MKRLDEKPRRRIQLLSPVDPGHCRHSDLGACSTAGLARVGRYLGPDGSHGAEVTQSETHGGSSHDADHANDHDEGHDGDHGDGHGSSMSLVDGLNGWQTALVTLAAIASVIFGGNFLTRPAFRFIAVAGLRELFVATALSLVVGIALLMSLVGLSPALGTFIAGVVLANSEYRHELESDIDPFRGLLLGVFS